MSVHITERDRELFYQINGFGFVNTAFVIQFSRWQERVAYKRIRKLIDSGYLIRERMYFNEPGVIRITPKGAQLADDVLPVLKKINPSTYNHDLTLSKLALTLQAANGGDFLPERRIQAEKGITLKNHKVHIPDGLIRLGDRHIAIELELSVKSSERLKKIINHYRRDVHIDEVWYFCGSKEVQNKLARHIDDMDNIKLLVLQDYVE